MARAILPVDNGCCESGLLPSCISRYDFNDGNQTFQTTVPLPILSIDLDIAAFSLSDVLNVLLSLPVLDVL